MSGKALILGAPVLSLFWDSHTRVQSCVPLLCSLVSVTTSSVSVDRSLVIHLT